MLQNIKTKENAKKIKVRKTGKWIYLYLLYIESKREKLHWQIIKRKKSKMKISTKNFKSGTFGGRKRHLTGYKPTVYKEQTDGLPLANGRFAF